MKYRDFIKTTKYIILTKLYYIKTTKYIILTKLYY